MSTNNFTISHSKMPPNKSAEEMRRFARTIDCLLSTCIKHPQLLELYLHDENPLLLSISLEAVKSVSWTERIRFLTMLLSKYPICSDEVSILCFICVCKFEFPWLPEAQQKKIKDLQTLAIKKVEKEKIERNRLLDLVNLAGHCLNIFNSLKLN